jgi:hypothetical protein
LDYDSIPIGLVRKDTKKLLYLTTALTSLSMLFGGEAEPNRNGVGSEPCWAPRKQCTKDSLASGDYRTEFAVLLVVVVTTLWLIILEYLVL